MKVENEKKIQRLEEEKTKIEQDLERFKYSGEAKLSRFPPDFPHIYFTKIFTKF